MFFCRGNIVRRCYLQIVTGDCHTICSTAVFIAAFMHDACNSFRCQIMLFTVLVFAAVADCFEQDMEWRSGMMRY
jgi:hypothetical protein